MDEEIITLVFGGIEIKKIHSSKKFLNDVDINNIFISRKISSGKKKYKYFIGYINDYKTKPLTIILPKTSTYVRSCEGRTKWKDVFTEHEELIKKYNDIWYKISNSMKK